jgi:hypothetical protein
VSHIFAAIASIQKTKLSADHIKMTITQVVPSWVAQFWAVACVAVALAVRLAEGLLAEDLLVEAVQADISKHDI